jgi:hypothetical protein
LAAFTITAFTVTVDDQLVTMSLVFGGGFGTTPEEVARTAVAFAVTSVMP